MILRLFLVALMSPRALSVLPFSHSVLFVDQLIERLIVVTVTLLLQTVVGIHISSWPVVLVVGVMQLLIWLRVEQIGALDLAVVLLVVRFKTLVSIILLVRVISLPTTSFL